LGAAFSHLQHHGDHAFPGGVGSRRTPRGNASQCSNIIQWQLYIMVILRTVAWVRTHAIFSLRYGEISSCTTPTQQLRPPNNRFIGFHLFLFIRKYKLTIFRFFKDLLLGLSSSFFLKQIVS
jgi:hypothetical protein